MSDTPSPEPTPTPPPPAPAAAPAAKKPNPIVRIGIGCLGVIVLGCIGLGGLFFFQTWQQEQNYNAGHAAYTTGDCATAMEPLTKAANGDPGTRDSDVARSAQADLDECQALTDADTLAQGSPADGALAYSDFVVQYDQSPLKDQALTKGQALLTAGPPEELATPDLCVAMDDLVTQQIITTPDEIVPPLLYACGQAYEQEGALSEAVAAYDRFRQEYPEHSLASDVQNAFVRATIAEAEALGAGGLPPPQSTGEGSGDPSALVTVIIRNDSPERLSMVFSGPETRVEELEPCADCEEFTGDGPDECPGQGPVGEYKLAPGSYQVVVKASSDGAVTPFSGTWELEGGDEYTSCFYLVVSN
jgi:tetratricopeptide (TPR) repeat protein